MKKENARTAALYDLEHTEAKSLLLAHEYPWEVLPLIKQFIIELGASLPEEEYVRPSGDVWVHNTASVAESAYITGPCIIGAFTEVRHCAFIRGSALVGKNCVVGNSTELKNVILFDNVQVPHYNYVGDSILGFKSHMGAGAVTSNVRSDKRLVTVRFEDGRAGTGLKKFGAMIGDLVEVGCGSVLNPGAVIGRNSAVYPLSSVTCAVGADSVYKRQGETSPKKY